ncbi:hypothetical protein [Sediminibacterium ginsengisoli]|uniref:Uncharacterized protein n=1 Tax=Sediminibacterium ginsengisoli TaxID=413434 RepID=A0A1T4MGU9_9BACT|nr:hypothetical protein [Sediminibacterium ginsengisoli]SJZ66086.1 hypothetical protein SAMN04488132_103382 [Sediminibacterium ginsengisoli]
MHVMQPWYETFFHKRYRLSMRQLLLHALIRQYEHARHARKNTWPLLKNVYLLYRLKGCGLALLQTQFSKKPKNPV